VGVREGEGLRVGEWGKGKGREGDGIRVGDGWGKERVTGGRVKGGRQEVG
jgi:hypothetical protein